MGYVNMGYVNMGYVNMGYMKLWLTCTSGGAHLSLHLGSCGSAMSAVRKYRHDGVTGGASRRIHNNRFRISDLIRVNSDVDISFRKERSICFLVCGDDIDQRGSWRDET